MGNFAAAVGSALLGTIAILAVVATALILCGAATVLFARPKGPCLHPQSIHLQHHGFLELYCPDCGHYTVGADAEFRRELT